MGFNCSECQEELELVEDSEYCYRCKNEDCERASWKNYYEKEGGRLFYVGDWELVHLTKIEGVVCEDCGETPHIVYNHKYGNHEKACQECQEEDPVVP